LKADLLRTDIHPILAKHPGLLRRMRFVDLRFEIRSSDERLHIEVRDERVSATAATSTATLDGCEFRLEAARSAWAEFSKPMPAPGHNDILALLESGNATFSGEGLGFYRNLFLVKAIVSAVFRGDARW
jgi:hypothetical protein